MARTTPKPKYPRELEQSFVSPWRSKRLLFFLIGFSLLIAAGGIFGFLFYQEYHKPEGGAKNFLPPRLLSAPAKFYNNDYWGLNFTYPGEWYPVIGSFVDGDYYFSSENINFIAEQGQSDALLEVQTYHNLKKLSFDDWLKDREENYFPRGLILSKKFLSLGGLPAYQYLLSPNKPMHNADFLDMLIISKDEKSKYIFILETKNQSVDKRFQPIFQEILQSLKFYPGFGS